MTKECPTCKQVTEMSWDKFEDMYRCSRCQQFWFPEDVKTEPSPDAGFLKLPPPKDGHE